MRLSELYNSTQGEGPRVGLPTTFVRLAGCNLKCASWPCDSPYAIDAKQYRNEWENIEPGELAQRVLKRTTPGWNVCITGGEPWLQNSLEMMTLITLLEREGRKVECFSNGTLRIPDVVFDKTDISFVFDCKLPGSGENDLNLRTFADNLHRGLITNRAVLKFTVASVGDMAYAMELEDLFKEQLGVNHIPVYVGAAWGHVTEKQVWEWIQESELVDWRLNVQVHKYIYGDIRGI